MKRQFLIFSFLIFSLIYSVKAVCNEWETIIPEVWKNDIPERCEFTSRTARHLDYMTGGNPFTGNVTIPPYVIERK